MTFKKNLSQRICNKKKLAIKFCPTLYGVQAFCVGGENRTKAKQTEKMPPHRANGGQLRVASEEEGGGELGDKLARLKEIQNEQKQQEEKVKQTTDGVCVCVCSNFQ